MNKKIVVLVIILEIVMFVYLTFGLITLTENSYKQQKEIDQLEIQVNSLWENVLQLQEEYGKIVDKLYNPEGSYNVH